MTKEFAKGAYLSTSEPEPASQTVDRTPGRTPTREELLRHPERYEHKPACPYPQDRAQPCTCYLTAPTGEPS